MIFNIFQNSHSCVVNNIDTNMIAWQQFHNKGNFFQRRISRRVATFFQDSILTAFDFNWKLLLSDRIFPTFLASAFVLRMLIRSLKNVFFISAYYFIIISAKVIYKRGMIDDTDTPYCTKPL